MATLTWDQVQSNPEYQKLAPEQQEAARNQYWDQVIAPQIPQEHVAAARAQFDEQTGPKAAAPAQQPAAPAPKPLTFGSTLAGEGDLLATGVSALGRGILHGAQDVGRMIEGKPRATGNEVIGGQAHLGESGKNLVENVRGMLPSTPNGLEVSDEELRANDPTGQKPIEQLRAEFQAERSKSIEQQATETGHPVIAGAARIATDVQDLAPALGAAKSVPGAIAGAVERGTPIPFRATAGMNDAAKLGFRDLDSTAGKALAGKSATPAVNAHNAQVGEAVINSEAGVAHGTTPTHEALAEARQPAEAVYERVKQTLPTGPFSPDEVTALRQAGGPGVAVSGQGSVQNINGLRSSLAEMASGDMPGSQKVDILRALRQKGFANAASADVGAQELGRAQLDAANVFENHIGANLPRGGPVTLDDLQNARRALAKNFTAESILKGNKYDLQALGRMHDANPDLFDGEMRTAAQFAASNSEAVAAPSAAGTPGLISDVGGIHLTRPTSFLRPVTGPIGRRLLTGGQSTLDRTNRLFAARTPEQFPPRAGLTPPPGQVGRAPPIQGSLGDLPQGPPPSPFSLADELGAGGPHGPGPGPGGIPLADVLSHGVERPPAPGLTAGPMGAPPQEGLPFHVPPEHLAGDLSLAPEPVPGAPERLGDLAHVASQGVPEGIAARAPQPFRQRLGDLVQPGGELTPPRKFEVGAKGKAKERK